MRRSCRGPDGCSRFPSLPSSSWIDFGGFFFRPRVAAICSSRTRRRAGSKRHASRRRAAACVGVLERGGAAGAALLELEDDPGDPVGVVDRARLPREAQRDLAVAGGVVVGGGLGAGGLLAVELVEVVGELVAEVAEGGERGLGPLDADDPARNEVLDLLVGKLVADGPGLVGVVARLALRGGLRSGDRARFDARRPGPGRREQRDRGGRGHNGARQRPPARRRVTRRDEPRAASRLRLGRGA